MKTPTIPQELEIQTRTLIQAASVYRAINHKLRQQILALLHKNEKMSVTPIYEKLDLEQSVASFHLAILRKANLVITERNGRSVYYSVNYKRLQEIGEIARQLISH